MLAPRSAVVGLLRLYRGTVGPIFAGRCRFVPTCSQYWIDAIRARGVIRGGWAGAGRLLRCHPWGGCGRDDPPAAPRRADLGRSVSD